MLITLYFPSSLNSDSKDVPLVAIPKSPSLHCSQVIQKQNHQNNFGGYVVRSISDASLYFYFININTTP